MTNDTKKRQRGAARRGCLVGGLLGGGFLLLLVLLGASALGAYNGMVRSRNEAQAKWSEIDNQYQRRADAIPNLVKAVQGSADFESSTLKDVTEARASVGRAQLPKDLPTDPEKLRAYIEAQNTLGNALSRLLVVAEQYPQLRATEGFRTLQDQIEGTENRIAVARRDYIDAAKAHNTRIETFPANLLAGLFNFQRAALVEVTAEERKAPQVDFSFPRK